MVLAAKSNLREKIKMSEKIINASGGFGAPEENLKEKEIRASLEAAGMLVPEEQDLADALLEIVDKYGKFNDDNTGVWAGYTSAKENAENAEIGVKCGNCVFWQAPNGCQIIVAETEENGLCRFAVLPDGAVTAGLEKDSDDPCWDGYVQVGMKKGDDGSMVPNCVPMDASTAYLNTLKKAELANKNEDEVATALTEMYFLDEKEFNVIKNAATLDPKSLEFTHNQVRLRALVSSGAVSPLLADIANTIEAAEAPESYYYSRENFLEELTNNSNNGYNPYDLGGKLTRLVDRGATKSEILGFLEKNTFFQSQKDLLEASSGSESLDMAAQLAVYKIKSLLEVLDEIEDLAVAPNLTAVAKDNISKYDSDGAVASLIDSGAGSKEVFEALKGNSEWESDAEDYLTRDDVEVPRAEQKASWNAFASVLFSIKDLDAL
jgi:hypothetical protein